MCTFLSASAQIVLFADFQPIVTEDVVRRSDVESARSAANG